jgi:predicted phage terminase large subunit-like protein
MRDLEDDNKQRIAVTGFREFAKSSLCSTFFTLWCIVFNKRPFIIFLSEDASIAAERTRPITSELQTNEKIINDFGQLYFEPKRLYSETKKKAGNNFETTNGIKIIAKGMGQSIRGQIYKQHRPSLLIVDDAQSIHNLNNPEIRDRDEKFLFAEAISGLSSFGKVILLGNMQHSDCLMARAKNWKGWNYHHVPIIEESKPTWPERYVLTDKEALVENKNVKEVRKKKISIESIHRDRGTLFFNQEYMLLPTNLETQKVKEEWIQYYEHIDINDKEILISIDPSIKEKEDSDYTAITVWAFDNEERAYLIEYVREKLSFNSKIETVARLTDYYNPRTVLQEDVAAQNYLYTELCKRIIQMRSIKPKGTKSERLESVSYLFENGRVFIKREHTELRDEITQFGNMPHDDLCDSATMALLYKFLKKKPKLYTKKPQGM